MKKTIAFVVLLVAFAIYVQRMAFYGPGAAHVMIGRGATNIEAEPFNGPELTSITVSTDNPAYSSMDGVLFDKNKTRIVICPCDKSGDYTIPDGVKSIGNWSFYTCDNLTSVTIPDSVTNIEENAFTYCFNLANVTIGKNLNNIGQRAFDRCRNLTQIYFHGNAPNIGDSAFFGDWQSTIYYSPTSNGWTNTFGGRPTMMMQ